jgi:hypothetical protein
MELKLVMDKMLPTTKNSDNEHTEVYDRGSSIEFNYDTDISELKICGSSMYDSSVFKLSELKNIIKIIETAEEIANGTEKR